MLYNKVSQEDSWLALFGGVFLFVNLQPFQIVGNAEQKSEQSGNVEM